MESYPNGANGEGRRLNPAEAEFILRRAAELNTCRWGINPEGGPSVSPKSLMRLAAAAGIPEADVQRAMRELNSKELAEARTISSRFYGPGRLRAVRELDLPPEEALERIEDALRTQELKLRRRVGAGSIWESGDHSGVVRRVLDFSGLHPLLKADSIELRVEELEFGSCRASLTADISGQRAESLSLGSILGATLALLPAIAGFQEAIYFVGALPVLAASELGFRAAYRRSYAGVRRELDKMLDAGEKNRWKGRAAAPPERAPLGRTRNLKPVPRFSPRQRRDR